MKYMSARNVLSVTNMCFFPCPSCFFSFTEAFSLYNCKACKRERRKKKKSVLSSESRLMCTYLEEKKNKILLIFEKQLDLSRTNILVACVCGQVQSPAGLQKITTGSIFFRAMLRSFFPLLTP